MGMPADRCECVNVCVRLCLPRPSTVDNTTASQQTCWLSGTTSLQHRRVLAKLYVDFYWSELLNRLGLLLTFTFLPFPFFSREIPFRYLTFSWDHTGLCGRFSKVIQSRLCAGPINMAFLFTHSFVWFSVKSPIMLWWQCSTRVHLAFFGELQRFLFHGVNFLLLFFCEAFTDDSSNSELGSCVATIKYVNSQIHSISKGFLERTVSTTSLNLNKLRTSAAVVISLVGHRKKMMVWFKIMQYNTVIPWDMSQPSS